MAMKGYDMYCEIQKLKDLGYTQRAASKRLNVHRNTVKRYWDMSVDEFDSMACKVNRQYKLDARREQILDWMRDNQGISAAQICDWLKEHYEEDYTERTVSRYVRKLREEFDLPKHTPEEMREYEAVQELPMGKQMQADFGMKWMSTPAGGRIKIYFAAYVLSNSRYKYTDYLSRPFTAADFVQSTKRSFKYFGGIPEEIVLDQDSIIAVDENYGDIIYTYEFEHFRQEFKFNVYLCRKSDPESKGKIENVVQYVKNNFLRYRNYPGDDETMTDLGLAWLERTANAKIHGTTKKVPQSVWLIERDYLRPLPPEMITDDDAGMFRTVRKDNTVLYGSNRYSVPSWVYNSENDVEVQEKDGELLITLPGVDGFVCTHKLLAGRGGLQKNNNHSRDKSIPVNELQETVSASLLGEADDFLAKIRSEKSRYARDQFKLIEKCVEKYGRESVVKSITYCMANRLYSATTIRDYLEKGLPAAGSPQIPDAAPRIPRANAKYHVKAAKRSISEYAEIGGPV
jgi:transposase